MTQINQMNRQTKLVPHVQLLDDLVCQHDFPQPAIPFY